MGSAIATERFPHEAQNVPSELKVGDRWVTCDEYKVPLIAVPNGACFAASSTNADTWRSYETTLKTYSENEHIAGIGRVIADDEDYVGIDLDSCLDETGELSAWAGAIVTRLDSYAEVSPSKHGLKIWVRAPELKRAYKKPGLEIYPRGRYFTVTGVSLSEMAVPIVEAGDELATLIEEEFPKVDRDRTPYGGPDRVLDLDEFLERSNVEILAILSDGAAERKYRIRCPWLEEHSDGDDTGTYVGQYDNGALFFACWHSHCAQRRWQELRALLNPTVYLGRPSRSKCERGGGRLR
jgi:primase-polymerase (primpol)-like protein